MTARNQSKMYRNIGFQIKELREAAMMTQGQLAGKVRIKRTSICNIEAGRQRLPIHLLMDIGRALGTTGAWLLTWGTEL